MSSIAALQQAINSNLDTLQKLYQEAEGLHGLIEKVGEADIKKELTANYDNVINTLSEHVDTTDKLIQALKRALND